MSARQAGGNVVTLGASPAWGRAAALMVASRDSMSSLLTWTSNGQASACKPPQRTPADRWLVATAERTRTDRWPFPEVKLSTPPACAARGSRASTDPRKPRNLFNPAEGLSMEKPASASLCAPSKFVPLDGVRLYLTTILSTSCKSLIHRMYTLCESLDSG